MSLYLLQLPQFHVYGGVQIKLVIIDKPLYFLGWVMLTIVGLVIYLSLLASGTGFSFFIGMPLMGCLASLMAWELAKRECVFFFDDQGVDVLFLPHIDDWILDRRNFVPEIIESLGAHKLQIKNHRSCYEFWLDKGASKDYGKLLQLIS